ncbi:MAG TPA: 50S ribosomal protein L21 [Chitinivibrionales bacterium]|nr:50S ribosomal protein L21 [Chitinivibrionales bacterium]
MFSIVEQDGFQFKVSQGDTIRVPRIAAEKGSEISLEKVLMVGDGAAVKIGNPLVSGAVVKAKVLDHIKGDKVLIMKQKRRKTFKKKTGHRQLHTTLQIVSISA